MPKRRQRTSTDFKSNDFESARRGCTAQFSYSVLNETVFSLLCRPFDAKNPFLAPVLVNRELHRAGNRSCMHIELDITGSKIKYVIE